MQSLLSVCFFYYTMPGSRWQAEILPGNWARWLAGLLLIGLFIGPRAFLDTAMQLHRKGSDYMRKTSCIFMIAVLFALASCSKNAPVTQEKDPYLPVIKAHQTLLKQLDYYVTLRDEKLAQFTQKLTCEYEALSEEPFSNFLDWINDSGEIYYALYNINSNNSKALFLGGDGYIFEIFLIQRNGIAVQQRTPFCARLLKTENLFLQYSDESSAEDIYAYYYFEAGKLVAGPVLIDSYFNGYFCETVNGKKISITPKEFNRLKKQYEGNGEEVELEWKPLEEYRK